MQQLFAPLGGAGAAAALPPEVGDQQLSYLLELVVAKRISAAQAQQVTPWGVMGPVAALRVVEVTSGCSCAVLPCAHAPPPDMLRRC